MVVEAIKSRRQICGVHEDEDEIEAIDETATED